MEYSATLQNALLKLNAETVRELENNVVFYHAEDFLVGRVCATETKNGLVILYDSKLTSFQLAKGLWLMIARFSWALAMRPLGSFNAFEWNLDFEEGVKSPGAQGALVRRQHQHRLRQAAREATSLPAPTHVRRRRAAHASLIASLGGREALDYQTALDTCIDLNIGRRKVASPNKEVAL